MQVGDFVRCLFPFREVRGPGPFPHIVLILALSGRDEAGIAYVAHTTTNVGFAGQRRPRQHLFVDDRAARALGQSKAFVIDVMRVAKLPVADYVESVVRRHIDYIETVEDFSKMPPLTLENYDLKRDPGESDEDYLFRRSLFQ